MDQNIAITRKVVEAAHVFGVSVEAELGRIGGQEDDLIVDDTDALYAVPVECERLVRETGVDCLAPALGSVHGPYKGEPRLGFDQMGEIQKLTGVPLSEIQRAISLGTAKINVNTENQQAFTQAIRSFLQDNPEQYDPRKYLGLARVAIKETVQRKMREFGSSGTC